MMLIGRENIKEAKVRYAASDSSRPDTILTSYRNATATDIIVRKLVNRPHAPKSAGPYMRVRSGAAANVNAWPRAEAPLKIPTLRINVFSRRRSNQEGAGSLTIPVLRLIAGEVSIERTSERGIANDDCRRKVSQSVDGRGTY